MDIVTYIYSSNQACQLDSYIFTSSTIASYMAGMFVCSYFSVCLFITCLPIMSYMHMFILRLVVNWFIELHTHKYSSQDYMFMIHN